MKAEEAKGKKEKGSHSFMSGRALFTFDPTLFQDDADAVEEDMYEEDLGEEETKVEEEKEEVVVDKDLFAGEQGADEEVDFD